MSKSEKKFIKIGSEIIDLNHVTHVKWTDEKEEVLQVISYTGEKIMLEAEAARALFHRLEVATEITLSEEDLPVRLINGHTLTTGMPHSSYAWMSDIRWDSFSKAYYITNSRGENNHTEDMDERVILLRSLTFEATDPDMKLYGGAYAHAQQESQSDYFQWENDGYMLKLGKGDESWLPFKYVKNEDHYRGTMRSSEHGIHGSGNNPSGYLLLSVYTKDENGVMVVVPRGEIKIYLDQ